MAAEVVLSAFLFLLACAAIFQSPDGVTESHRNSLSPSATSPGLQGYRDTHGPTSNFSTLHEEVLPRFTTTEEILADVLRRCDVNSAEFFQHRQLVSNFISDATAHLAKLSKLLVDVTAHHDGSAFEGTRTTESADFDAYVLVGEEAVLGHFELRRGAEGRTAAKLRPGVSRGALPTDLVPLVTANGYLDARLFKKWAFERMGAALRRASASHLHLKPVVYATHGAVRVNLTAPDGALLQVDLSAQLAPPPTQGVIRPEALTPCGLRLVLPGRGVPWSVYSNVDLTLPVPHLPAIASAISTTDPNDAGVNDSRTDVEERWFVVNTMKLERRLLSAQPRLRQVVRLLKSLSSAQRWEERFHVASFILKHAVFWAFAEGCETEAWNSEDGLLRPTVASLLVLENALRRGRLDKFFVGVPSGNALGSITGGRPAMRCLSAEVHRIVVTLMLEDHDAIRSMFNI